MQSSDNKIIVITRRTRLAELVSRFNTVSQAKFYLEHLGADFSDYQKEDEQYGRAVHSAEKILSSFGRVHVIDRGFLPNFIFGPEDLVVVIGQDGLVANTLKYLDGQWLVAVNPDPQRWDGKLLPFCIGDLTLVAPEALQKNRKTKSVTMARATLNNGQNLYAVNDLFIGPKSHISARYVIETSERSEEQSSSGIIVSTGMGSTGWFKSLLTGALGISNRINQNPRTGQHQQLKKARSGSTMEFPWDANYLYFTVREPFPSKTTTTDLCFGQVSQEQPLRVISKMPENGVIFSDGLEKDFLEFNSGTIAHVGVAEKHGTLVV
jgi:NAD kinase